MIKKENLTKDGNNVKFSVYNAHTCNQYSYLTDETHKWLSGESKKNLTEKKAEH